MKYLPILLLLFPFMTLADIATFTFTPPTEREDNSPLPPEQIGGYNVFLNDIPVDTINPLLPTATGFTLDLPSGAHTITVTTLDTDTRESVMSVPVEVGVPFNPKEPSNVEVVVTVNVKIN